ncbi:hypothetical protein C0J52_14768 [Blattella germanica]|nr:hypothetical protein C0J52_14768 [Blattella germanica]
MLSSILSRNTRSFRFSVMVFSSLSSEVQHQQLVNVKSLPIIHHHGYVCDLPPKHRFPMKKFHGVFEHLIKDGVISKDQVVEPRQVTKEVACAVHNRDYVDKFFNGKTSELEQRPTGFVWTPGLASRVRYETGGTLLAAQISQQRGLACSTAGGTHHAFPDRGAGFCLLNDLAVTAQHLIDTGKSQKVLIVDLDVHQVFEVYLQCYMKVVFIGLFERDYYVISTVTGRGCPCATVIGGGYSQDLDELSKRHTIVHRAATKVWQDRCL